MSGPKVSITHSWFHSTAVCIQIICYLIVLSYYNDVGLPVNDRASGQVT